jgi:hypothetical protein
MPISGFDQAYQRLGGVEADEQWRRGRAGGDGDGVEVGRAALRLGEGGLDDGQHGLDVVARGDLRHDAAVAGVDGGLRGDNVGQQAAAVGDDADGGLIAGGLDAEGEHGGIVAALADLPTRRNGGQITGGPAERAIGRRAGGQKGSQYPGLNPGASGAFGQGSGVADVPPLSV